MYARGLDLPPPPHIGEPYSFLLQQYSVVRTQMSSDVFRAILQFVYAGSIDFENDEMGVDFAFELVAKGEELGFER